MIKCPVCLRPLIARKFVSSPEKCYHCDEPLADDIRISLEREYRPGRGDVKANDDRPASLLPVRAKGQDAIDTLRFFAWANLVGGIIIAIYVWATMGTVGDRGHSEGNPFGVVLGLAFFIEGVFGCAFLLVVCTIAENLIAIRKNTENYQKE
jgi:hypothetical protein